MKKLAYAFAAILVILGGAIAGRMRLASRTVQVARAQRGVAVDAVYATGRIEPRVRVTVKSAMAGTMRDLDVREGERIQQGSSIGRVEVPTMEVTMRQREAELRAARVRAESSPQIAGLRAQEAALRTALERAREELTRIDALVRAGTSPASEVDRQQQRIADLEGEIASNRSQQRDVGLLSRAELDREQMNVALEQARASQSTIRSPIEGTVLQTLVEPGEMVTVGQAIVRVGDLRELQLEANVDETDVGRLSVGGRAIIRLAAMAGRTFRGHVRSIAPDADRERNSYRVIIQFDEQIESLRAGLTAEVDLVLQEHRNVIIVPSDVVHGGRVWIVDSMNRLRARQVVAGIRGIGRVEITSGLNVGDRVVVGHVEGLEEGTRVRVEMARAPDPQR